MSSPNKSGLTPVIGHWGQACKAATTTRGIAGIAGSLTWVARARDGSGQGRVRCAARRSPPSNWPCASLRRGLTRSTSRIRRLKQDLERYRRLQEHQSISAREVDSLEATWAWHVPMPSCWRSRSTSRAKDLARTRIVAPFDGMVTRRFQQTRAKVCQPRSAVAQLVSTRALEVRFSRSAGAQRIAGLRRRAARPLELRKCR